ncbi:hypothetical protein BGX26_000509 [Mortierella sp. AD094]|nr:hypothetical protein BGX26_000509 [Mortierella sp. AD094]
MNNAIIDAPSPMEYESEFPVAVFREGARLVKLKQKAAYTVNKQDCDKAIRRACIERLQFIIKGAVTGVTKKKRLNSGQTREALMLQERERVFRDEKRRVRLPRKTLDLAATILRNEHGLGDEFQVVVMRRIQIDDSKNFEIWARTVELEFNNTWDSVQKEAADQQKERKAAKTAKIRTTEEPDGPSGGHLSHEDIEACQGTKQTTVRSDGPNGPSDYDEDDDTSDHGEDDDVGGDGIRTCTVPLSQILRTDLRESHYEEIIDVLQDRQAAITDDMNELSILVHLVTLSVAAGDLHSGNWEQESLAPKTFDITSVLPSGFQFRSNVLPTINVAPIPTGLQDSLEAVLENRTDDTNDHDLALILSQDFLQYVHTSFLGVRGSGEKSKLKHPIWERAVREIQDASEPPPKAPRGLSNTITEAIREYATVANNLWEGGIYHKSLDYLLRILLRIHLAPQREVQHKEQTIARGKRKQEAVAAQKQQQQQQCQARLQTQKPSPGIQTHIPSIDEQLKALAENKENINIDEDFDSYQDFDGDEDPESDEDEDDLQDDQGHREPSRSKLRSLQAVLKVLVESPCIEGEVDRAWVRKSAFRGSEFTTEECDIVAKLANWLRPYVPKRRPSDGQKTQASIPHVALRAPIVLIANTILRATGYHEFTRRLAPQISTSSSHGIALGAVGIYECLCSNLKRQFDVMDVDGNPLTSYRQITAQPLNKRAVFGAFFDLKKIDSVCRSHGLEFRNRIVYVDRYTIRLVGNVVPHGVNERKGQPVVSRLDQRKEKQKRHPQSNNKWTEKLIESGMTKQEVEDKAKEIREKVREAENNIKAPRKELRSKETAQTLARREANRSGTWDTYEKLREARIEVRTLRNEVIPLETNLRLLRRESYYFNKLEKAPLSSEKSPSGNSTTSVAMTVPTWNHYTVEDDVQHLDISQLTTNCRGGERMVVFSGSDYGLRTMSQTVAITRSRLEEHQNYYYSLTDPSVDAPSKVPHVPASNAITAKQINDLSHTQKMSKRREKRLRKPENRDVREALEKISDKTHSLSLAVTKDDINKAHQATKGPADSEAEDQPHLGAAERRYIQEEGLKETQTGATDVVSGQVSEAPASPSAMSQSESMPELSIMSPVDGYCQQCDSHHIANRPGEKFSHMNQCPSTMPTVLPVMLVGDAGTAVGSRIKGHAKRGGRKLRQEHMKHCPVVLTDEYRSSKTCIYCFGEVRTARARRIVNGEAKMVRINGALECVNPMCPSVKVGYTIKSRDPHSALAIALAGASALLSLDHEVLLPFSRTCLKSSTNNASSVLESPSIALDIESIPHSMQYATGAPLLV